MNEILDKDVLAEIQGHIQTELTRRGYHAPVTLTQEGDKNRLYLTSEPFQTTPVIFRELRISEFGATARKETVEKDKDEVTAVYIGVNVRWKHFDGGENGTRLFTFTCWTNDGLVFHIQSFTQ